MLEEKEIEHATKILRSGRLAEAQAIFRRVLQSNPNNPDALHLMGVISLQMEKNDEAIDFIKKALVCRPDFPKAHNNLGVTFYKLGRFEEAIGSFQEALHYDSDIDDVYHNLGNSFKALGRQDEAAGNFRKAIEISPNAIGSYINLGDIYRELGDLNEALAFYQRAVTVNPNFAIAHNHVGNVLKEMSRFEEAVDSYQNAISIEPNLVSAHHNLGLVFQAQGKTEEAIERYKKTLNIKPDYALTLFALGSAWIELGELDKAEENFHQALAINPEFAEVHSSLGDTLKELGRLDEAVICYQKAITIDPERAGLHNNLGVVHREMGDLTEALESYRRALLIEPDYAAGHQNLGNALLDMGKLDEAIDSFRMAVTVDPDFAEAHRFLAHIKKHTEYDQDIQALERAYAKPGVNDEQKMHLCFGLGSAFENLKEYDKAFSFFAEGNAIKRRSLNYSIGDHANFFRSISTVFDHSLFDRHKATGIYDETPIFILGLPRSGTTLVEQILASHPNVYGAGEIGTMSEIVHKYFDQVNGVEFPQSVLQVGRDVFERLGSDYVNEIRKVAGQSQFITNKSTGNHINLGIIKLALPNAKVIHCNRNPEDNGLSLFKTYFSTPGKNYSYDLGEIGRYFHVYNDLTKHWRTILPGFIYDVQYEDLIENQIEQTRILLDFCGLEWNESCLDFHKADRPVKTASVAQVRKPIYKSSVQLWRQYEQQLAPMLHALR